MNQPEKGMTTKQASAKKLSGHKNEEHFAHLIGGTVNPVDHNRKQDVHDLTNGWRYSVKAGKKWQIFLYSRNRFENNTTIRGIGKLSVLMIQCIDTLPSTRDMREANPDRYKAKLKTPMQKLSCEFQNEQTLHAFFSTAAFDAGRVDFWAILPSSIDQTKAPLSKKIFHVFDAQEAVNRLCKSMEVTNSTAKARGQVDSQKVVFRCDISGKMRNVGEIELRTDKNNYGRMKFWLLSDKVLYILKNRIPESGQVGDQIILHGKARKIARKIKI